MEISEIYNKDVYTDSGQYLGEVRDAIIDLEKGEVSRLLMEEWRNPSRDEVKRIVQGKSVLFKNIKNIGDVVLVSTSAQATRQEPSSAEAADLISR